MKTQTQITDDAVSIKWLYAKGWTVRQASEAIGRSWSHVAHVLKGERKSGIVVDKLRRLPDKEVLSLRGKNYGN